MYPGLPGKSAFPASWGQDKIMHNISDLATRPGIPWKSSKAVSSRSVAEGSCEGVRVRVIIDNKTQNIITGHPIP